MSFDSQVISLQSFRDQRRSDSSVTPRARVVAVTGGKGGVGKSFIAANLAAAAAESGARTLAVDADLGMADLNLLLGVAPEHSLLDVLCGTSIRDVIEPAHGFDLLPGLNGSVQLANLDDQERHLLLAAIDTLDEDYDVCVVDTPPGIDHAATDVAAAATHVVVVLGPEPVSLADAYSCLKALCVRHGLPTAYVVPNGVRDEAEADEVFERLRAIVDRFLGISLVQLPSIPHDPGVGLAAALGIPLVCHVPDSPAARAVKALMRKIEKLEAPARPQPMRLFGARLDADMTGPMLRASSEVTAE